MLSCRAEIPGGADAVRVWPARSTGGRTLQRTGALTLSQAVIPRSSLLTNVALIVAGSLFVALSAQIAIYLLPVPVTGQTFGVLVVGAALGSRRGALALVAYLGEGLAGLPVFAAGHSAWTPNAFGEPVIVGSTAGYLVGFVIAAYVVGWLTERYGMDREVWSAALLLLVGNVVVYIPGLIWLQLWLTAHGLPASVWQAGLVPFIPGDIVKLILAAAVVPGAWRLVRTRSSH
ncbi:MAG: biotin transporter BioY [Chloroflexi bacterium]|nr:biotin transporter BioY [Chloroflexota bacterium]